MNDKLIIKNARVNNLKGVSLEIPKNQLIVFTGLSGSGKSSLAFDTIYAEGQRRYVESLSSYARQFLGLMEKPDVEYIEGLSPAISIDQKSSSHNPRSTVGTVTEIYDYLRLLFARIGQPYDPKTNKKLSSQTVQEIVERIKNTKGKFSLLAPMIRRRKGTYDELFQKLLQKGFNRVRVDGKIYTLEEEIKLDRFKAHDIDIVVDRISNDDNENLDSEDEKNDFHKRITDSVETCLSYGTGQMSISFVETPSINDDLTFSENYVLSDGSAFPKLEPHLFSFNAPSGACPTCSGLGYISEINKNAVYNPRLTISEGGIFPWSRSWDMTGSWYRTILEAVCEKNKINTKKQMGKLSEEEIDIILYGTGDTEYKVNSKDGSRTFTTKYEGVVNNLKRRFKETDSEVIRNEINEYMTEAVCNECNGARLRKESLCVKIAEKNILEITNLSISDAKTWIDKISDQSIGTPILSNQEFTIAKQVLKEISNRLNFLISVGLDYITLGRTAKTLSGGESQRIRLASQIGSGLTGVMYILDEPSIGLHQKDNAKLIETLKHLRDIGNTVIVVEHDEDTILSADWIVEIGPNAGEHGGEIIFNGSLDDFKKSDTLTAQYLTGKKRIEKKEILKSIASANSELHDLEVENYLKNVNTKTKTNKQSKYITINNAFENNLKNLTVSIPLGKFVTITGASGSGKSTLINDILSNALMKEIYGSNVQIGKYDSIDGIDNIDKVVVIDQSPIGRTPRSNPATYTGVFQTIREIFASTKEAKLRGYTLGRFSFNTKGGRCEKCKGDGTLKIEMQFLPDVYVTCETCNGKRYNQDTLSIDYKGKNISDILNMTVEEAIGFFSNINTICSKFKVLDKVGLGYIKVGQSATTLSGGEAQRVKLATELAKRQTGKTMYILDEPTTGLHFADIEKLLMVLHSLVQKGNSIVVIEHNLDVIKTADWVIDLGPEGGQKGGEIVCEGTVQDIMNCEKSYTGKFLKKMV